MTDTTSTSIKRDHRLHNGAVADSSRVRHQAACCASDERAPLAAHSSRPPHSRLATARHTTARLATTARTTAPDGRRAHQTVVGARALAPPWNDDDGGVSASRDGGTGRRPVRSPSRRVCSSVVAARRRRPRVAPATRKARRCASFWRG